MDNQFNIAHIFDKKNRPTNLYSVDIKGMKYTMSREELDYLRLILETILKS